VGWEGGKGWLGLLSVACGRVWRPGNGVGGRLVGRCCVLERLTGRPGVGGLSPSYLCGDGLAQGSSGGVRPSGMGRGEG